jgi:release factor glutamine methyltransferase
VSELGVLLRRTARRLATAGIADADLEADLIWMTALELDRPGLYAALRDEPSPAVQDAAAALEARRLNHEPAAYLMGVREFYGLTLAVAPGVLVPRQDTEALVEEALRLAGRMPASLHIADVGCGSGAIGLALAAHLPGAVVHALDITPRALELTALNAERTGVTERVRVLESDLLAALPEPVHLMTANLPYVCSWEIPTLEPEVRLFEPREALDGGDDGLDLYRRLLAQAPAMLLPGGALLAELDPRQMAVATALAREAFPAATVRTVNDLAGRKRVVVVEQE